MVFNKKLSRRGIWLFIAILLFMIGVGVATFLFIKATSDTTSTASTETSADAKRYKTLSKDLNNTNDAQPVEEIVAEFGPKYDKAIEELTKSNVKKWTQADVDKAHFSLLYADKIGASSQVVSLYRQIFGAKQSGVNVDQNAAGMTEQDRKKIFDKYQGDVSAVTSLGRRGEYA